MSKTANTTYPIAENLADRWSPRAFREEVPEEKVLLSALEAARWAASSYNEQPWRFVVGIKGKGASYEKIFASLNEFNQKWAEGAPVLMMICAKEKFSHNEADNKHFMYDCGAAMSNFCAEATRQGLYVHQMAGILPDKARDFLGVPDDYRAITAAAVGYLGEPDELPKQYKKSELAERKRKPLGEISFLGTWGESFD